VLPRGPYFDNGTLIQLLPIPYAHFGWRVNGKSGGLPQAPSGLRYWQGEERILSVTISSTTDEQALREAAERGEKRHHRSGSISREPANVVAKRRVLHPLQQDRIKRHRERRHSRGFVAAPCESLAGHAKRPARTSSSPAETPLQSASQMYGRSWPFADIRVRSPPRNDEARHKAGLHRNVVARAAYAKAVASTSSGFTAN
jgi:hypothetical protein